MVPRLPSPRNGCLILVCLGSTLAAAAEAPYTDDFNNYPNGSVPANFVETPNSSWSASGGNYYGGVAASGAKVVVATGLPLTNVSGRNFTVKTTFAASTNGGIDFRLANLGLVALGDDPNLTQGGYRLGYYVSGLYDVFGKLSLERAGPGNPMEMLSSLGLNYFGSWQNPSASPRYTMTLEGVYIDGTLFLTGTVSDGVKTISIQMSDPNPLTGPYFGFRQWASVSSRYVAGLNVWYDDFSVTLDSEPTKLANISTRVSAGNGEEVPIAGFVVTGNSAKRILVRGGGGGLPGLDWLPDPVLELRDDRVVVVARNDNWQETQEDPIRATGLQPLSDRDSAVIVTLQPGEYTALLRDKNGGTGMGLVELYDLDRGAESKLGNLSTRGQVGTGDKVMIAGVIATGDENAHVIVRSLGPSLRDAGIAKPLADPTVELRDQNGAPLKENDNWRDSQQAEIIATSLAPAHDAEAAIVAELVPGIYTAIVRGKHDATGIALVELYHLN